MKFLLFPAGASSLWLYQNMTPEAWNMALGIMFGLAVGIGWIAYLAVQRQNNELRGQLAETRHQLQISEDHRRAIAQPRPGTQRRASMRRRSA